MRIDPKNPAYTSAAASSIKEKGGKLGGLDFLRQKASLRKAILPLQIVRPDDTWHGLVIEAGPDDRVIIRGSHPNDFSRGLVDVLLTQVVSKNADIGKVIHEMRTYARSPKVLSYGQYESADYDGQIIIGVQAYLPCVKGNVVEHPNRPGEYLVSLCNDRATWNKSGVEIDSSIYRQAEDRLEWLTGNIIQKFQAKRIVQLYNEIEKSGLVQDGLSFQVEFLEGYESLVIAQVRAFHQKRVANFQLKGDKRLVFGVTGPDGIELPVLQSPDGYDWNGKPLSYHEKWAFLKTRHDKRLDLEVQPKNMKAYLVSQSFGSGLAAGLEHHHFQLAQKADITVFENQLYQGAFNELMGISSAARGSGLLLQSNAGLSLTKTRIISDGRNAVVEPVY